MTEKLLTAKDAKVTQRSAKQILLRALASPLRSLRLKALGADLEFLADLFPLSDSLLQLRAVLF